VETERLDEGEDDVINGLNREDDAVSNSVQAINL